MTQLITLDDIKTYKPLSINLNEVKKVNPYILEAQQFDLKKLIGSKLYVDILRDYNETPSLSQYSDLFNGSTYQYEGNTYSHEGLKMVLIYFSYARIVFNSNFEATAHGTRVKKEEYSEPVNRHELKWLQDQANSGAMSYWEEVEKFICRNIEDYPLYRTGKNNKTKTIVSFSDPLENKDKHGSNT